MKNSKKPLWISLISLDVALTIFLFVVSIVMLATMPETQVELDAKTGMIGFFQKKPTLYLVICVIPLFLLLAGNVIALVMYVRKSQAKKKIEVKDLTAEQKEALRQELLKELSQGENKSE